MAYETPLPSLPADDYERKGLYQTVLFGAKKLNKDHKLDLILNLVPNDKIEPVLNALGYKLTVLTSAKEEE